MQEFYKQCVHPMARRQMTPRHMVRLVQAMKGYFMPCGWEAWNLIHSRPAGAFGTPALAPEIANGI